MPLRLRDETAAIDVLEISGGGALIGIGGAADSVHILAVCGNPIIKSNGLAYDQTVQPSTAAPAIGSVTADGSGNATVTTNAGQPVVTTTQIQVTSLGTNTFTMHGGAGAVLPYEYF